MIRVKSDVKVESVASPTHEELAFGRPLDEPEVFPGGSENSLDLCRKHPDRNLLAIET
jgi:hypothetical protein